VDREWKTLVHLLAPQRSPKEFSENMGALETARIRNAGGGGFEARIKPLSCCLVDSSNVPSGIIMPRMNGAYFEY